MESGKIVFRENVKILTVNYNVHGDHHKGAKEFMFWYMPQIQYKNPEVQILSFRNITPTPFLRCYLDDGKEVVMDVFGKSKEEIHDHLQKTLGKSEKQLQTETQAKLKVANPANFGLGCDRHCICEIPGQLPCPNIVPIPKTMRGKYKYQNVE